MKERFSEYNKIIYMQMTEFSRWKAHCLTINDEKVRVVIRGQLIEIQCIGTQIRLLLNPTELISQNIIKS